MEKDIMKGDKKNVDDRGIRFSNKATVGRKVQKRGSNNDDEIIETIELN
jgi:hypothetical protein